MSKAKTHTWMHLSDVDKQEPAAEITLASVIAFRNGLAKLVKENKGGDVPKTMRFRAMVDLDHLARLMDAEAKRTTVTECGRQHRKSSAPGGSFAKATMILDGQLSTGGRRPGGKKGCPGI